MKYTEHSIDLDHEGKDETSALFPYPFTFRTREQLQEYFVKELTKNRVVYVIKIVLGSLTLVLPLLNVFMVYRSVVYQREDFGDTYSAFHSIIFYGEFALVHVTVFFVLIDFLYHKLKSRQSLFSNKGEWVNLLDVEFTFMAFNLIKLIPILSVNSFNFILTEISICTPIFLKYSRSVQAVTFTLLTLIISIQVIIVLALLLLINLVKVYQVSFVGETRNPLLWSQNQWLLFIGFAANIINITDTPTISQLSFMWTLMNKTWSHDTNMWFMDKLGSKRKIHIVNQLYERLGFLKAFLWLRTMSAIDLHCIVRLPPPLEESSSHM
ncbi:unnamed protein product [Adineta ricciae]|uniref:Uncharacterized protein n=2 Tax=Adineta ricciae TaxID=249248 RepID=A0A814DBP1_ADIRI|nr:unnamed protein product [Adineta ricciae]